MSLILCMDTSIRGVSAALVDTTLQTPDRPLWAGHHLDVMSSASQIGSLIATGLSDIRRSSHDVTGVVCSVGPGSFTGIKIGLAFVGGFTAGRREICKVRGVSSLDLIRDQVLHRDEGDLNEGRVFLPATKTHGFVSEKLASTSETRLVALEPEKGSVAGNFSGMNYLIGDWPLLQERWPSPGTLLSYEEAARMSMNGMIGDALRHWYHGFSPDLPAPRYMRLSTAEERLSAQAEKE